MEYEKMIGIIAELLDVDAEKLSEETSFSNDLHADSLDIFQIMLAAEQEFRVSFTDEEEKKVRTIGDMIKMLKANES